MGPLEAGPAPAYNRQIMSSSPNRGLTAAFLGRNALAKLASEFVGRAATFVLSLYVANALGQRAFGAYNYGLALGFVVAQIADMGLQLLTAREVAIAGRLAQPLVARALRLKVWLSLPAAILLILLLGDGRPAVEQRALLLLGLAMLAQTFLEFAAYVYRGQQRLLHEAWLLSTARLLTAALAGAALFYGGDLAAVGAAYLLATAATALWGLWRLHRDGWFATLRHTSGSPQPAGSVGHIGGATTAQLLREAVPLGLAIFLSIGYTRIAVFLLEYRVGPLAVARYSAAHRLVEPAQILPAALLAAVFPAFSRALYRDRRLAIRLAVGSSLFLAIAGMGAALLFWFGAPWLIPTLYGATFVESVPVLQILSLSVLPAFLNYNLTHILIARGQQRYTSLFVAIMLAVHAGFSWFLIPALGPLAPAVSVTFAEVFLLFSCTALLLLTRGNEL